MGDGVKTTLTHSPPMMLLLYCSLFLSLHRCVYRFEAQRDERIRIIIRRLYTRTRQCLSRIDSDTKRSYCFGDTRAKVEVCTILHPLNVSMRYLKTITL